MTSDVISATLSVTLVRREVRVLAHNAPLWHICLLRPLPVSHSVHLATSLLRIGSVSNATILVNSATEKAINSALPAFRLISIIKTNVWLNVRMASTEIKSVSHVSRALHNVERASALPLTNATLAMDGMATASLASSLVLSFSVPLDNTSF